MSTFKREERYIVIKRKHFDSRQEQSIRQLLSRMEIPTIECIVVEKDWPEYESTWKAIEERMLARERMDFMEAAKKELSNMPPFNPPRGGR